jgi:cytoskeletal protein CcmA (bactofilin family)
MSIFNKDSKPYTDALGKTNRIVEGTKITGNIESLADFRLDGTLLGNFTSKGKLVIGPAGSVIGNIFCKNADIEGNFEGKIEVSESLSIKKNAKIKGEVFMSKLSVEPGADFTANCYMNSTKTGAKNVQEKQQ